ncbi:hypothetical protein DH2020_043978 [Rehmannia glutinosa]|uniref:Vacuolar protein 14 C-terminal Fig4-binding domain-containing protein n=1 Tax=Rehmannia glutinosa TaxID=99300 RepID=A0ABR0UIY6_REHGL
MADAISVIPAAVLRNLSDKLYEKRKNAALEVEGIVKQLASTNDHEKIAAVINLLANEYTYSPQANHRKGGLIGLAAATVGLTSDASQHLDVIRQSFCQSTIPHLILGELPCIRSHVGFQFIVGVVSWGVSMKVHNFFDAFVTLGFQQIVPPVLNSFSDQDSRVRYYACEALYNIAKVVRGDFIVFFNDIFDALCKLSADSDANVQSAAHLLDRLVKDIVTESDQFSIEEFIPLLRERMNVLNPYVRQFLVGWITVLDSVPDIDMLGFLPDFLDGLFNMLSDSSHEIRQQADSALSEFLQEIKNSPYATSGTRTEKTGEHNNELILYTRISHSFDTILMLLLKSVDYGRMAEILVQRAASPDEFTRLTAITWINEFVKLGGDQLVPHYADILGAILPCISDKEEKIRVVARETNEELRGIQADPAEGFDVGAILSVARRHLSSEWEATRIEALHWISTLLNRHRTEALSDPSDEVVLLVLEVHACIAKDEKHFDQLIIYLIQNFRVDNSLLEKRGALIIRRLCVLLDDETVYRKLSNILQGEPDLDFASVMVQTYQHASSVIQSLVEEDINVKFLVQLDKLIHLLETPTFAYLRLQSMFLNPFGLRIPTMQEAQFEIEVEHLLTVRVERSLLVNLLEPGRYIWLLKALYGLLMLLPQQSVAFKILRTRLKTVPSYSFSGEQFKRLSSGHAFSESNDFNELQILEDGDMSEDQRDVHNGINFVSWLQQFQQVQERHRVHSKTQALARYSSTSSAKEIQRPEESKQPLPAPDMNSRPPSRSSRRSPGQLQL